MGFATEETADEALRDRCERCSSKMGCYYTLKSTCHLEPLGSLDTTTCIAKLHVSKAHLCPICSLSSSPQDTIHLRHCRVSGSMSTLIIVSESRENGYKCTPPFAGGGSPRSCDTSNLGGPLSEALKRKLVSAPSSVEVSELDHSSTPRVPGVNSALAGYGLLQVL